MAAPHGTARCTRPACTAAASIRDHAGRPWCAADYALIFKAATANYRRFLGASITALLPRAA